MISICIPTYNYDVTELVQALELEIQGRFFTDFEILIIEDGSTLHLETNSLLQSTVVQYKSNTQNVGRSKIRNQFLSLAKNDYLLFIDADAIVTNDDFLARYRKHLNEENVLCGGLVYQKSAPESSHLLRWKYGKLREEKNTETRNSNPYAQFSTFNFLAPKTVLVRFPFNESIVLYGHEDTLFGLQLKQQQIPIIHIENPLLHNGLEENEAFLNKVDESLLSLIQLKSQLNDEDQKEIKLLRYSNGIPESILYLIALWGKLCSSILRQIILATKSVALLDLYKLQKFIQLRTD